jgi:hypothetical protein
MKDKYTQPALRIIEANHRNAISRLLSIAIAPKTGETLRLAATGEAVMLAATLGGIRKKIARDAEE